MKRLFLSTINLARFLTFLLAIVAVHEFTGSACSFGADLEIVWTRSQPRAMAQEASVDAMGQVFLSGMQAGVGDEDAFVQSYDRDGHLLWNRRFGIDNRWDEATSIVADGLGGVFVTGMTNASLGGPQQGGGDAYLRKYDSTGTASWTTQLGRAAYDQGHDVAVDRLGNIFVVGQAGGLQQSDYAGSPDGFIAKYNSAGALEWLRGNKTPQQDFTLAVATDLANNVYVGGIAAGVLGETHFGGFDAFLAKYTASGDLAWLHQFGGAGDDNIRDLVTDRFGNIYASGRTTTKLDGTPVTDGGTLFLRKYDVNGNALWTRQEGNTSSISHLAMTNDGNILLLSSAERMDGPGQLRDEFEISTYDAQGRRLRSQHFGEVGADWRPQGIATDFEGNIFVALTQAKLGQNEAMLVKLSQPIPEPSGVSVALVAFLCVLHCGRRRIAPRVKE